MPCQFKQTSYIHSHLKISQSINVEWRTCDMAKTSTVVFMKERTSLVVEDRHALIKKKTEDGETWQKIRCVREQQICLWPIFYQMDFMKKVI